MWAVHRERLEVGVTVVNHRHGRVVDADAAADDVLPRIAGRVAAVLSVSASAVADALR